jgi:hypothetical protein
MSKRLTGLAMLAFFGGSSPCLLAAPAAQWATADAFAKPHQLVNIGGRKMNLFCSGQGLTTVVFDAPSGEAGWN